MDTKYRVTEWLGGDSRILFVVGLAGSGKTTLSQEYKKLRPEATVIHTDEIDRSFRAGKEMLDTDTYCNLLVEHIVASFDGPLIIEGVHVLAYDKRKIKQQSIIIKGTSFGQSTLRAIRRDLNSEGLTHLLVLTKDNIGFNNRIINLKKFLRQ